MELYKHNKTGHCYKLVETCINATNKDEGKVMVIYRSVEGPEITFVRDLNEFNEKFTKITKE